MEEKMFIKPAPGLMVKDPVTGQPLPEEGDFKPRDIYWNRRLLDNDVIETKPPKPAKEVNL